MLTKILFTAFVILVLMFYIRHQQTKQPIKQTTRTSLKASPQTFLKPSAWLSRIAAYSALALILATGALFYYLDWTEDHRVINIRVINTNTGEIGNYLAYQSMIRGRSFVTLDGRTITIADTERVEMSETE